MDELGTALLVRARNAIAQRLGLPPQPETDHPDLHRLGATFVTLTQHGHLRGCIGTLEAYRSLDEDVRSNAVAAAFHDPRFEPLQIEAWRRLQVEVSLLSEARPLRVLDEADALRQLRPHLDGVIFEWHGRRSTFLPQVWETLSEPASFMAQLKQKAGLPADFWADDIRLYRYEVRKWKES